MKETCASRYVQNDDNFSMHASLGETSEVLHEYGLVTTMNILLQEDEQVEVYDALNTTLGKGQDKVEEDSDILCGLVG